MISSDNNDGIPIIQVLVYLLGAGGLATIIILLINRLTPDQCNRFARELNAKIPREQQFDSRSVTLQYHVVSDTTRLCCTDAKNTSSDYFFERFRKPAFENAFAKLEDQIAVPYNKAKLQSYVEEALQKKSFVLEQRKFYQLILVEEKPLLAKFKSNGQDSCEVEIPIALATPKDVELLIPSDIRNLLGKYIEQCPEFIKFKKNPANKTVNIGDILTCLTQNPEFSKALKEYVQKYRDYLQMVDIGMQWLVEDKDNIYFERGGYEISGVYLVIIDQLKDIFQREIQKNPSDEWTIVCYGYADPGNIIGNIPYTQRGKYDPANGSISLKNGSAGTGIPRTFSLGNAGNQQLSYARAYAGIKRMEEIFSKDLPPVDFQYQGKGIDRSEAMDSYKRRIEFKLFKK
ncbi:MAG: hypothetical protein SFU99_10895 [Saprospiraceae bacterium]|nr:hypothetical protein [Saprospiraceae bacterium]